MTNKPQLDQPRPGSSQHHLRPLLWICITGLACFALFVGYWAVQMRTQSAQWQRHEGFRLQADLLESQEKWDQLLTLAQAQVQTVPDNPYGYWMVGQGYFGLGQYDKALTAWEQAEQASPSWKEMIEPWRAAARGGLVVQRLKLPMPVIATTAEHKERQELRTTSRSLLLDQNYTALETQAELLRESETIFPLGRSKLASFYDGLAYLPDEPLLPSTKADPGNQEQMQALRKNHGELLTHLERWSQAKPASVTAQTALAYGYLIAGWLARGTGTFRTVSPAMREEMEKRLEQASSTLESTAHLREKCPVWYTTAQQVALLAGWPEKDYADVYAAATQDYPAYQEIFFQRAKYLLPRWHGEPGEWEKEIAAAADNIASQASGERAGDIFYARCVWFLMGVHQDIFEQTAASWPRTKRGMEALLYEYPDSVEVVSAYCWLAHEAKDYKVMQKLYRNHLKDRADQSVWRSKSVFAQHRGMAFGSDTDSPYIE